MEKDPFHANCLPVHIGTLVELNKANGKKHNIFNESKEALSCFNFTKELKMPRNPVTDHLKK